MTSEPRIPGERLVGRNFHLLAIAMVVANLWIPAGPSLLLALELGVLLMLGLRARRAKPNSQYCLGVDHLVNLDDELRRRTQLLAQLLTLHQLLLSILLLWILAQLLAKLLL